MLLEAYMRISVREIWFSWYQSGGGISGATGSLHIMLSCRGNPAGLGTATTGSHNVLPLAWPRYNLYGIIFQIISGAAMRTDDKYIYYYFKFLLEVVA